ncbi:MAG: ATP-binding cassette domain-containing protein, partial [Bacteroidota bacterium]
MNYLHLENVSKLYGDKVLFKDISLQISRGQKVALVAKNGTGKSTLLRVIAGLEAPEGEKAKIEIRKDIRMGYLPQEPEFDKDDSILESVLASDHEVIQAIRRYQTLALEADSPCGYLCVFLS